MPTILVQRGWRVFFYSHEGDEPMHVHRKKGDMDCKYWLDVDAFDIREDYSYRMTQQARREIRAILFEHFHYIAAEWIRLQKRL